MPADWWPEFSPRAHLRSPALQLKEQAAILKQKTDGLVTASVVADSDEEGGFKVLLLLGSPHLGNYKFRLLELHYPPSNYPLELRAGDEVSRATNEAEFAKQLNSVLGSSRTKEIVEAIMAHAVALDTAEA